MIMMSDLHLT